MLSNELQKRINEKLRDFVNENFCKIAKDIQTYARYGSFPLYSVMDKIFREFFYYGDVKDIMEEIYLEYNITPEENLDDYEAIVIAGDNGGDNMRVYLAKMVLADDASGEYSFIPIDDYSWEFTE